MLFWSLGGGAARESAVARSTYIEYVATCLLDFIVPLTRSALARPRSGGVSLGAARSGNASRKSRGQRCEERQRGAKTGLRSGTSSPTSAAASRSWASSLHTTDVGKLVPALAEGNAQREASERTRRRRRRRGRRGRKRRKRLRNLQYEPSSSGRGNGQCGVCTSL